ncbi:PAP2 superfamily protein (macronuclear) [Tetrahymena thermophila SB210]|uniref:PAP2 superfamily protein n=1 Tax=Tetrahymena thermophila (strain SB210) TaxID=312017 RepID=I7MA46_TETTS|nr:PAP2 superfamily protein [Tetrahymena thermophila SB210]EAS03698.1 PAP2 superfamily protein [Tetrahymena thermophila SB210]|eukprot:XP_001023943.1 PAP2 superfamily protein [Tetrahymena thermophila SB210]
MENQLRNQEENGVNAQLLQHRDSNMINPYQKNRNVYTKKSNILLGLSIFLIVLSTILNILFQNTIFNTSLDVQQSIQKNMDVEFLKFLMNIISNFVNPTIVIGLLILIFAFSRKKFEILNFLLYFAFVSYICSIMKTLFASPRPYWVGNKVSQWEWVCYQEYGNPSGHSLLGPIFYEFILRNYILRKINKENKLARVAATIGIITLVALILFCRLYLGMHALNQVFYGLIIGISLIILYRLYFEITIKRVLLYLVRCNIDNSKKPKACVYILSVFLLCLILCINIYILQDTVKDKSNENQWEIQIEDKCNIKELDPLKAFYNRCFIDCSGVCICFSLMLGFLYSKHPEFLLGRYSNQSNVFLRSLVITISSLVFIVGFILLPTGEMVFLKFFFQSIGVFAAGFCLIYLAPILLFKYNLVQPIHKELQSELTEELSTEKKHPKIYQNQKESQEGDRFSINANFENNHKNSGDDYEDHDIDFQNTYDLYKPQNTSNGTKSLQNDKNEQQQNNEKRASKEIN